MMNKQDARKLSPQAQEDLRRRVVRAIVEGGMKQAEAARVFGVGRTSIHHWLRAYEAGGDAALKARKRGPKRISRLKGHQAATIVNMIEQKHPEQLQLPFTLWTREAVGNLIRDRLAKHARRKVFLIVDGHRVHRSRKVRQWLQENVDRIEMFRLRGCSPDLNGDELLNQDVKTNAVGRRRPGSQNEMISDVRSYLRSTQKQPHIVRSYFNHEDVRYAAAS